MSTTDHFPTDTAGLPEATSPEVVELADGAEFDLSIAPVAKRLGGRDRSNAWPTTVRSQVRPSR